jgi:hypothetical protein
MGIAIMLIRKENLFMKCQKKAYSSGMEVWDVEKPSVSSALLCSMF